MSHSIAEKKQPAIARLIPFGAIILLVVLALALIRGSDYYLVEVDGSTALVSHMKRNGAEKQILHTVALSRPATRKFTLDSRVQSQPAGEEFVVLFSDFTITPGRWIIRIHDTELDILTTGVHSRTVHVSCLQTNCRNPGCAGHR